jgi:endonuclease/exonuclease/phosphatase family metal-dependent hydrolase
VASKLLNVLLAVAIAGCAPTVNLLNPNSPKFEGSFAPPVPAADSTDTLKLVTWNVKLADNIGAAIEVLRGRVLRHADIITLEEMDEAGADRIARSLKLNYVYYPGSIHPTRHRYFGPAIFTRWPIEKSWKLLLPYEGGIRHQRRTATAALVRVGRTDIRVYAVHLETPYKSTRRRLQEQVDVILTDASIATVPVVIAGDFNSQAIGSYLKQRGFAWLTEHVGRTISFFSWDHIFVRGLPRTPAAVGKVTHVQGASDHRPVWAKLVLRLPLQPIHEGAHGPDDRVSLLRGEDGVAGTIEHDDRRLR